MVNLLASRMSVREEDTYEIFDSFEIDFETDDGREHTIIYAIDDNLYEERGFNPVAFLSDFMTGYNEFSEANAIACAEMLDMAEEQMMITAADDYELRGGYTHSPERYDLCVTTYGPMSPDFDATMSRPSKPEGVELVAEEEAQSGTRFVVRDWNGQLHQILFDDGKLIDSDSGYSWLSADTLDATFAAIRFVQAEHLARGNQLETAYEIELYNADSVTEYRQ